MDRKTIKMPNAKVKLFITGGTIDKKYNELDGSLDFERTHLPAMLATARCTAEISSETILLKDSLEMTDDDRSLICEKCAACHESQILISHGTDTMAKTGEALAKLVKGKTVVLFGAMIPYSFGSSDALFNLGYAMAAAQMMPEGIYIAMNGQLFHWDNVIKNKRAGIFETSRS